MNRSSRACQLSILSVGILLMVGGCGRSSGADFTVETLESGVIETTYTDLQFTWLPLDTVAVWDIWSGESGYHFNRITTVAGIDDGFLVLDAGNRQVVETSLHGEARNVFGNRGEGPGEFGFPRFLNLVDDEVWVGDILPTRFSVFGRDGAHRRTISHQARLAPDANRCAVLPDGRVVNAIDAIDGTFSLLAWNLESGATDTLAVMQSLPPVVIELHRPDGSVVPFDTRPTFAAELWWAYQPSGRLVTVTGEEYAFEERDIEGGITRRTVLPTPDLTATERDREHFLGTAMFGTGDGLSLSNEEIRRKWKFAERRQAIGRIAIDPPGRIWVLAHTGDVERNRIDVFAPDHRYLGSIDVNLLPLAFAADGTALFRVIGGEGEDDTYFTGRFG